LVDILTYETRQSQDISLLQQEDLAYFGKLIFELCCGQVNAMANLPKALQTIDKNYTPDVKNVAMYLVKPSPHKSIRQLLDMMGSRVLVEMREMQKYGSHCPLLGHTLTPFCIARLTGWRQS
jgi:PAB-dependent poly(A)-specific ribonuclease subunit 3